MQQDFGAVSLTLNLVKDNIWNGVWTPDGIANPTAQVLSGNGAVGAVSSILPITTIANTGTANTTATLAAGAEERVKTIAFVADGGFDAVVTVTNPAWGGAGTITMNDVGDSVTLQYLNALWVVTSNNGCTLA
jgi:hypothetical protein